MKGSFKSVFVAFRVGSELRSGIEINFGSDIYVNVLQRKGAHVSYHESGQKHIKLEQDYITWGDLAPDKPMKWRLTPPHEVTGREEVTPIGWTEDQIRTNLPIITPEEDSVVLEVPFPNEYDITGIQVSVVGTTTEERDNILELPIFWRQRITNEGVTVEIEAFGVSQNMKFKDWDKEL